VQELSWNDALELASPFPYVLATSIDASGKPNAIGLGWWTITSWEPQMIAISVGLTRYSRQCIDDCKEFVLCFPSEELKEGAWLCGTKSGKDIDKLKEAGLETVPAKVVKPPIIGGSTVAFECKVVSQLETGDHILYVGQVVAIHGTPDQAAHLYSVHYKRLVSLDCKGACNFEL